MTLGASAVAICRAGLTCGGLGGITVTLGASAVAICRAGHTCGGLGGTTVTLGASVCGAVCHEGLEETSRRMMRTRRTRRRRRRRRRRSGRRSGFDIEFQQPHSEGISPCSAMVYTSPTFQDLNTLHFKFHRPWMLRLGT